MMKISDNDKELLSKVEWEGSILAAIDSGVRHEDFENQELQNAWRKVEGLYDRMFPYTRVIEEALDFIL